MEEMWLQFPEASPWELKINTTAYYQYLIVLSSVVQISFKADQGKQKPARGWCPLCSKLQVRMKEEKIV